MFVGDDNNEYNTVKPLYSGHLSITDTSLRYQSNHFLSNSPLYSGHLSIFSVPMVSAIESFNCITESVLAT